MADSGGEHGASGEAAAPAGWYPVDDGQQRYWDGTQWTDHMAPLERPAAAPAPATDPIAGPDPFTDDPFKSAGFGRDHVPFNPAAPAGTTAVTSDDRTMATLIHVLSIFTGFLAPLIIWLLKKDESAFVDHHGKESLNFHITMILAWIVTFIASLALIGLLFIPVLLIVGLLFPILAAVAANRGEFYRFPVAIRFLS